MSYAGTTSTAPNPPVCLTGGLGVGRGSSAITGNNRNVWYYISTNLTTDLTGANFFSDGWYLGMRPGDMVLGTQYSSLGSSIMTFQAAITSASTAGAGIGSTNSIMTSTFS